MKSISILMAAFLILMPLKVVGNIIVSSTFDTILDGWVGAPESEDVLHDSIGGNPGGYAHFRDRVGSRTYISAPSSFLGNWLDLGITSITYDHKVIVPAIPDTALYHYTIEISGPGGAAIWESDDTVLPEPTDWITITALLPDDKWFITSGTWEGLLTKVTTLNIYIEMFGSGAVGTHEECGIDNVLLRSDCECEGNFDGDQDVDGSDAATFKADFGRSSFFNPCTNGAPCNGDFDCDGDVDGTDASVFKSDFGRSGFNNPCPVCTRNPWCVYP